MLPNRDDVDSGSQLSQTTYLVTSVFRSVWDEFVSWEQTCSQQSIAALQRSGNHHTTDCDDSAVMVEKYVAKGLELFSDLSLEEDTYIEVMDCASHSTLDISYKTIEAEEFMPYAPYESCTPSTRNIFQGDDADSMGFVQYDDDPKFDRVTQTKFYGSFSWQIGNRDPDLETTILETVSRLSREHNIPLEHIEETGVLPLQLLPRPGKPALMHRCTLRDLLDWPGRSLHGPSLLTFVPAVTDLKTRLNGLVQLFCPNLNCVQPCCSVHLEAIPIPHESPATISNSNLLSQIKNSCGNQCCLKSPADDFAWDSESIRTLQVILSVTPDILPCDLAVICRKPCREVYAQRYKLTRTLAPREVTEPVARKRGPKGKAPRRVFDFNDVNAEAFAPNDPCQHEGPCDVRSRCACYTNKSHCQRGCRCSTQCNRRWAGCQCAKGPGANPCSTDQCPCVQALRECDPDLCGSCDTKNPGLDGCRYCHIRLGRRKALEVKNSRWGLGAFIAEDACAGDLIGEYAGELIFEPTCESREVVVKHRKRNYIFGLNATISLDSSFAGNETRYINHAPSEVANCRAFIRLVNGDHRIGLFATKNLKAGNEVLFDYGPAFFKDYSGVP